MTILYCESRLDSDIAPYHKALTSNSGGVHVVPHTKEVRADGPILLASYATEAGVPNAAGVYAKTATATLRALTSLTATVYKLRLDLHRYKTTGDIASATGAFNFHHRGQGRRDRITRPSGSWIADGFTAGCQIFADTSYYDNDGVYTVETVSALTLTLEESSRIVDTSQHVSTIGTKEKLLVAGTPTAEFSHITNDLTLVSSFSDTFAADDRIVAKLWAYYTDGGAGWLGVETEGAHPFSINMP